MRSIFFVLSIQYKLLLVSLVQNNPAKLHKEAVKGALYTITWLLSRWRSLSDSCDESLLSTRAALSQNGHSASHALIASSHQRWHETLQFLSTLRFNHVGPGGCLWWRKVTRRRRRPSSRQSSPSWKVSRWPTALRTAFTCGALRTTPYLRMWACPSIRLCVYVPTVCMCVCIYVCPFICPSILLMPAVIMKIYFSRYH